MNNNAGTNGQFLMSKGNAEEPVWTNAAYTGGGRFVLFYNNNSNLVGRQGFTTTFASATQDDSLDITNATVTGSDFTLQSTGLTGNHILINRSGLYHFEGTIRLFATIDADVTMFPRGYIKFKANQITPNLDYEFYLREAMMDRVPGNSVGSASTFHNLAPNFSTDIYLLQGTTVTFLTGLSNLKYPLIALGVSTGGYISGHFISE